jgi:hypothetical protein
MADNPGTVAILPLSGPERQSDPYRMGVFLLLLLAALVVAAGLGWGVDSRDFADWRPTDDGRRLSPR